MHIIRKIKTRPFVWPRISYCFAHVDSAFAGININGVLFKINNILLTRDKSKGEMINLRLKGINSNLEVIAKV